MNFTTNQPIIGDTNIAQAGTLTMEFGTLSKYTGNDTYRQLAEKSAQAIMNAPAPLPALPGQGITAQGIPDDAYVVTAISWSQTSLYSSQKNIIDMGRRIGFLLRVPY